MRKFIWLIALLFVTVAFGCHSRTDAPKAAKEVRKETQKAEMDTLSETVPTGKKARISVLMDAGKEDLAQFQIEQREQVNDFMGRDLVAMLNKAGYEASLIENRSRYTKGTYLLKVTIVRYNAGSKALRYGVGFGAGAVSLDTRFELFAPGGGLVVSDEHGVGSSIDWTSCARKLNKQTVEAVSVKLK